VSDLAALFKRMGSVIGHELRNPMAVINNSAYFLKSKIQATKGADPKLSKHIEIIESEIKRANALIGEIVAFSRPLEPKLVATELENVVKEALDRYTPPENVTVESDLKAKIPASVDPVLVQDALKRLLDNAAEAMAEGGTIKVKLSAKKGWAALEVEDAGAGFRAEQLELLKEPFYTTKSKALGLGLTHVQKIADAHKGKLEAGPLSSGKGSVFRLLLPA
jgi:signal transduction histidine kinase